MNSRTLRQVAIASLLFNLFLLGGIAGGVYRWFSAERTVVAQQPRALRYAAQDLSQQRFHEFAEQLQQTRRESRDLARASRDGRLEVTRLLAAQPLDPAALNVALAQVRNADQAYRIRIEQTIAAFAAGLTPEERVVFAAGVQRDGLLRVAPKAPPPQQLRK